MPTPPIGASNRYFDVAVTKVYYLPAIAASTLVPTRTEMTAGINLTPELVDWAGWAVDSEYFDTQNLNSSYRTKAPGIKFCADSSVTLYTSKNGVDVRSSLAIGATGYMMFCDGGDIGGNRAEIYPVAVGSAMVLRSSGNDTTSSGTNTITASWVKIGFAITGTPNQAVIVPA